MCVCVCVRNYHYLSCFLFSCFEDPAQQVKSMKASDALVLEDGTVYWIPRMFYKLPMSDSKNCSLILGSWAHDVTKIKLNFVGGKAEVDTSCFEKMANNYKVTSQSAIIEEKEYDACPGALYGSASFKLSKSDM